LEVGVAAHNGRKPWTEPELHNLLARYFGDRLSPREIERLVADTARALHDRPAQRTYADCD
jgi:hypothetical protein